jgi:hypothetical protein
MWCGWVDIVQCAISLSIIDSHLSLILEDFFKNHMKPHLRLQNFIDESNPEYGGPGSELKSKYLPLYLEIRIGGAILSGRFVVSSKLKSTAVLLGTNVPHPHNVHSVFGSAA